MAWTTPLTAVSNATLTAAQWNATVRDNLLETAPAKATAAGQIFASTGANAIAARTPATAHIGTSDSTSSGTFGDLGSTVGPQVTVTCGTSALVSVGARLYCNSSSNHAYMTAEVSGATSRPGSNGEALASRAEDAGTDIIDASRVFLITGLTPGSNTFKCVYRVSGGTGVYEQRNIVVIPF